MKVTGADLLKDADTTQPVAASGGADLLKEADANTYAPPPPPKDTVPTGTKPPQDWLLGKPVSGIVQTPRLDNSVDWSRVQGDTVSPPPGVKQKQNTPHDQLKEWMQPLQGALSVSDFTLERTIGGWDAYSGKRPVAEVQHDFSNERLAKLRALGVDAVAPDDYVRRGLGAAAEMYAPFKDLAGDVALGAGGGALFGLAFGGVGSLEGAQAGAEASAAVSIGKSTIGNTFLDMVDAGVPEASARPAATAIGIIVGAEQSFGMPILSAAGRKLLGQKLAQPAMRELLDGYIGAMLKGSATQTAIGDVQAVTELLGKTIIGNLTNVSAVVPTTKQWVDSLANATVSNAAGGGAMGAGVHATGTLLNHLFGKTKSVQHAAEMFGPFREKEAAQHLEELRVEAKLLEAKIADEQAQAEAQALKIVEDREKEIQDFHKAGGVDRYVPARITIAQAREIVARNYRAAIEQDAQALIDEQNRQASNPDNRNPVAESTTHQAKFPLKYQQGMVDPDGWEKTYIAPPLPKPKGINPLSGHIEMEVAGTTPLTKERAMELAEANYADQIEQEAQDAVVRNDRAIKASSGSSEPPQPINIKQARQMVANSTTPSDLVRQAKQVLHEIGFLEAPFDYKELPSTSREKTAQAVTDFEKKQEAELAEDEKDAAALQSAIPPHDPTKPDANKLQRALRVGEKPLQTWTAMVNAVLVFAKGDTLETAKAVLDMTEAESNRSNMVASAATKLLVLYGEAVEFVPSVLRKRFYGEPLSKAMRALKLIHQGTRKRKTWGTYYDAKGNEQQLSQKSANNLLDLHLRGLDSDAHEGYRNAGYTLKGETRGWQFNEPSTQELVEQKLTEHEDGAYLRLGDALIRFWDYMHPATAEHYANEFGKELPKVKYYSGQIEYEVTKDHPQIEQPENPQTMMDTFYNRKNIDPHSLKEREGAGNRALKVGDPFKRTANQMIQVLDWIAFSRKNRKLARVLGNNPVTKAQIEQTFGQRFFGMVKNSYEFNVGARKEQIESRMAEADALVRNMATGYLGGDDLTQFTRQVSGFINMAGSEIGPAQLTRGVVEGLASPNKMAKYLEASTVYKERKDAILQELRDAGKDRVVQDFIHAPVKFIKHWGALTTRLGGRVSDALGGYAVYRQALADGLSHEKAVLKADGAVDRTQSSQRPSQRTPFERGGAVNRTLLALQKQNIQMLNLELNAWRRLIIHRNDAGEVAKQLTTLAAIRVAAILFTAAARSPDLFSSDPRLVDSAIHKLELNAALGGIISTPLLIGDVIEGALTPEGAREPDTTLGRLAKDSRAFLSASLKAVQKKIETGDVDADEVWKIVTMNGSQDLVTIITGIPVKNTNRTIDRTKNLIAPPDSGDGLNAQ